MLSMVYTVVGEEHTGCLMYCGMPSNMVTSREAGDTWSIELQAIFMGIIWYCMSETMI